jgi:hypothetical protein
MYRALVPEIRIAVAETSTTGVTAAVSTCIASLVGIPSC